MMEIREGRGVGPEKDHIYLHLNHLPVPLPSCWPSAFRFDCKNNSTISSMMKTTRTATTRGPTNLTRRGVVQVRGGGILDGLSFLKTKSGRASGGYWTRP